jgi:hypothetical protein
MHEGAASSDSRPRVRTWIIALVTLVVLYSALAGLAWWVRLGAHDVAVQAQHDFAGDEVQALLGVVQSERHSLTDRNRAVYALGLIGDARALPVLQRFYTGGDCDHARLLCQKELHKALDRCNGRNWAPAWLPFFPRPPVRGA